jgi:hypothetical protein
MKGNYTSLQSLAIELDRRERMKDDYIVPSGAITADDEGLQFEETRYQLNGYAHGQLANRLSIPKKYYDAMSEIPGLRAYNVQAWLNNQPEQRRLIRTLDGRARAILADRFKPIDNHLIMQAFLPALQEYGKEVQVVSNGLSDKKMYLQVTFPGLETEVKPGDVVRSGILLTNSEVGAGAVDVQSMIWRLACTNGMVTGSMMRKYHVGRRAGENEEDYDLFADDTIRAELESFRLRLRDIIAHSLTDAFFKTQVEPLIEAADRKIVHPVNTVEKVTKQWNFSKDDGDDILSNMVEEANLTQWGLANGITALAKNTEDLDRQYDIERIGAEIIELKSSEWELLTA